MGTKRDPGLYDCHAKAKPDEPLFTLVGRDPIAFKLVEIWAALRGHNFAGAEAFFWDARALAHSLPKERPGKTEEAFQLAAEMEDWAKSERELAVSDDAPRSDGLSPEEAAEQLAEESANDGSHR